MSDCLLLTVFVQHTREKFTPQSVIIVKQSNYALIKLNCTLWDPPHPGNMHQHEWIVGEASNTGHNMSHRSYTVPNERQITVVLDKVKVKSVLLIDYLLQVIFRLMDFLISVLLYG